LNGLVNGVLNGSGGGAGEFDEFIDWVFHIRVFVFSRRQWVLPFSLSAQTTGRADPLLWGKTLPQFENGREDTAYGT
jgi:hypothetical protein